MITNEELKEIYSYIPTVEELKEVVEANGYFLTTELIQKIQKEIYAKIPTIEEIEEIQKIYVNIATDEAIEKIQEEILRNIIEIIPGIIAVEQSYEYDFLEEQEEREHQMNKFFEFLEQEEYEQNQVQNQLFEFLEQEEYEQNQVQNQFFAYKEQLEFENAIKNNNTHLVQKMIDDKTIVPDKSELLIQPVINGNVELVKILLENGIKPVENTLPMRINIMEHGTLLRHCARNVGDNFLQIAKLLVAYGADVNYRSPLMESFNCTTELFRRYLTNSRKINTDIVYFLVENGADVNYQNKEDGVSILMSACGGKINAHDVKYDLVKLLIEKGADVNHLDKNNNSALMKLEDDELYEKKYPVMCEIAEMFVPETKDIFPSEKIMKLLIDNGADVNQRNNMGMTPLMHYAFKGEDRLVKILLENGADINAKSEMTAFDLAGHETIKNLIQETQNNNPQRLVKLLSNFTIDKPIKYTTHIWDFGTLLSSDYKNFDGYMNAVKKQFEGMKDELEKLSPNLYKKIYTFLIETAPNEKYSWCSKTHVNIGWSSLAGLKEHCDSGEKPSSFVLPTPLYYDGKDLTTFEDIINLFKQEIEIRGNFRNLETMFTLQKNKLGTGRNAPFKLDLSSAKLNRQFYTDVEKFSNVLDKIFADIKTRKNYPNIEVNTAELEDRSIEIKIIQNESFGEKKANELLKEVNDGDFADIKESLSNLCDWSVESSHEDESFRVNFLHSNNVKDVEIVTTKPKGFTYILRFYK